MTFKAKTIDEWCEQKFPELTETGQAIENAKKNEDMTAAELQKELAKDRPLMIHDDPSMNLVVKPTRFERKCLVSREKQKPIPCYFHGWFQLNTPTKDGSVIAYPVGIVEHRDNGIMEQVKVTSIRFVEVFEEWA